METKFLKGGAKIWYFPDGYLPQKIEDSNMEAHEALMLLNTNEIDAQILLDFYFSDRPPVKGIKIVVGSERIVTLRLDHPEEIGGLEIPELCQYSIRIVSNITVVAQFGRLDTTQINMAYYGSMGFFE